jgi:hypothetical protein
VSTLVEAEGAVGRRGQGEHPAEGVPVEEDAGFSLLIAPLGVGELVYHLAPLGSGSIFDEGEASWNAHDA